MRRGLWMTLAGLLLALVLALAFFPATWAWSMVRDRVPALHLQAVHGSVWHGRADGVVYAGMPLGTVRWTLSRRALLGRLDLHLQVHGPLLAGHGRMSRRGRTLVGRDMRWTIATARLPVSAGSPPLRPRGELVLRLARVELHGDWPSQLRGQLTWHDAALAGRGGATQLGDLQADLTERAGTVLIAHLSDRGGPLALSGTAQASLLGWRLDADLRPRGDDPALRRLLQRWGPLGPDDTLHLHRRGGLMMGEKP